MLRVDSKSGARGPLVTGPGSPGLALQQQMSLMSKYVTSPKGISGKLGGIYDGAGHSPILPGDFGIHIRDQLSPLNREIN